MRRHGSDDLERLRHAARARFALLRHLARIGTDDRDAVGDKLREIAPRRRMAPHARIHGGRDQHRLVGREQHRRGEVVRMAARHLGHQVGGRGRHHDDIGVAGEPDMADVELGARIEQVDIGVLARDGARRQRRDEFLRGLRHHDAHRGAALPEAPDQVERLVGRDPAADDEQDALAVNVILLVRVHLLQRLLSSKAARNSIARGMLSNLLHEILHG